MNMHGCRTCGDDRVIHEISASGICLCNSCRRRDFSEGPLQASTGPSIWETLSASASGVLDMSRLSWGLP